eukprot:CAMPEP_0173362426 /NCGR_PEP_ID=MMETSP1144-20121109/21795_1 /TAXON_ID=483371 /ORGANISM="non described non described, Strain CCMP2298" /LENGTH=133 /DNA_ID=CAMNT_0014312207 /DNA_START=480 /DNA_END=882 /DNA_ORIENTATION=-
MAGQFSVLVYIRLVQYEVDKVKPGEQGGGQLDVVYDRQFCVVSALHGVGGGQDGGAGVEGGDYAGLGDGDCLLLHCFVQDCARLVRHLIELVNAADAVVGQHQGPTLQHHVPGLGVATTEAVNPTAEEPLPEV